jgi:hypothetical protein
MAELPTFEDVVVEAARRVWLIERRAGVEHFRTGQHLAWRCAPIDPWPELFVLAYAPIDGHQVILLPVARKADKWEADHSGMSIFSIRGPHMVKMPEGFALSERMIAALEEARGG